MQANLDPRRKYRITASQFGNVLANPKTKRYNEYLDSVVYRLKGNPEWEDNPPWFAHGNEWEKEALNRYEWETGTTIDRQVFKIHPDFYFISCTADGYVIELNGGVENKCRKSLKAHLKSKQAGIESAHKPQVQGTIWIFNAEWWDFQSYYKLVENGEVKATDVHIHRVYPDEKYIKKLEKACIEFWDKVQERLTI